MKDSSPKIALVFDDLIQFGGAEELLLAVHEVWPEAPVYTSVASEKWQVVCSKINMDLRTSFMQKFPLKEKLNRFYSVLGLHMLAFETFDFSNYDLVISVSSRYAHGIVTKPTTKHICYMNSPGRMFWSTSEYFSQETCLIRLLKVLITPFLNNARMWDFSAAQRVDYFIANSEIPQKRIKKYYKRNSTIIYPFVDLSSRKNLKSTALENQNYFLILTRLSAWKRVDIAIKACKKLNLTLKIIGEGPSEKKLKKLAKKSRDIEFLGYVSNAEKWKYLANAQALIMTQKEDFGITPLEAMSVGTPVVAYGGGGAIITVKPGETGRFFDEQNVQSLINVLKGFDRKNYKSKDCRTQAETFSRERFVTELKETVNKVYLGYYDSL